MLGKVPGFRSGVLWKKILASMGYIFVGLGAIGAIGSSSSKPTPKITTEIVTTSESISCQKLKVDDANLEVGKEVIKQTCKAGKKEITWQITKSDGLETGKTKTSEKTSVEPIDEITSVGTKKVTPAPQSQPTPAPSAGSSGSYYANCTAARNAGAAPLYRGQPGYRSALDRDGDGVACE